MGPKARDGAERLAGGITGAIGAAVPCLSRSHSQGPAGPDMGETGSMDDNEALVSAVQVDGRDVVDIGCGAGGLVRWLRERGARTVGVECGEVMLQQALELDPDHQESYVEGVGQDVPLPDACADVVVFMYSLHHVPADHMLDALRESHRLLRPGGELYVAEPLAEGPSYELGRLVDDEAEVRRLAQEAMKSASLAGLEPGDDGIYVKEAVHRDFAAYESRMVGIDPTRREAMDVNRAETEAAFNSLGRLTAAGYAFDQPVLWATFRRQN